jgi:hypothetical protein
MFGKIFFDRFWNSIGEIGSSWQLLNFEIKTPMSWEKYWQDKLVYWTENKEHFQYIFGYDNPEKKLLEQCKNEYKSYKESCLKWNQLCKVGEKIQIIHFYPNSIVLSKNWKGEVSDHSDLELCLKEEKFLLFKHIRFCCEIYSFGTLTILPEEERIAGVRAGDYRRANRLGDTPDRNETVSIFNNGRNIKISDAVFAILS